MGSKGAHKGWEKKGNDKGNDKGGKGKMAKEDARMAKAKERRRGTAPGAIRKATSSPTARRKSEESRRNRDPRLGQRIRWRPARTGSRDSQEKCL